MIRKVAVLGAGVMGAQIAGHLANANVETILFDLPAKEGAKNGIVQAALTRLTQLKPAPLVDNAKATQIRAANYEDDLKLLDDCDLIIEAIAERLDWKQSLYEKVAAHISKKAIFATNTSGISIEKLSSVFPEALKTRFCGVHFFNPPRYMKLVELIPSEHTEKNVLDELETFLVTTLGKGVVRAKDTPNFIGNRIGVFSILAILHHTEQYQLALDEVDALTGPLIGRAKSATYRTLDVVGIDTMNLVVKSMSNELKNDPWHEYFALPAWVQQLIEQGAIGQKAEKGVYKKEGKDIKVFNVATKQYEIGTAKIDDSVLAILKIKNPKEKFEQLRASSHKQAQFLWAIYRDVFHYAAYHLAAIAHNVRDVDLAMRWGYGWQLGVFETWQLADWSAIAAAINADITAKKAMANVALPNWVNDTKAVYNEQGAYSPNTKAFEARSTLPVYQRQCFPERVLGETAHYGKTIFENDGIVAWTQDNEVLIVSFKTKGNTFSMDVLQGINQAVDIAEANYKGLVFWQNQGEHFSYGADLTMVQVAAQNNDFSKIDTLIALFQKTSMRLKYAMVPTIAAVRGMALGGGCELAMHCSRVVAASESYFGLVEAGVGLLPAGGGTKEFAVRAAQMAKHEDLDAYINDAFSTIAMAKTSGSAQEAVSLGYLRASDIIVLNKDEILFIAQEQAVTMFNAAYRPALPKLIPVAGIPGIANRQLMLVNMRDGRFISDYDYEISVIIADTLCGGHIEANSLVDELWLLRLERENFIALCKKQKTQERIVHTLKTGKPLRN